jgi:hypothetical protein
VAFKAPPLTGRRFFFGILKMWHTLKRLFSTDAARNSATAVPDDLTKLSTPELVGMAQELGRAQDAIKDKRKALASIINARLLAPPVDAAIEGQALDMKVGA